MNLLNQALRTRREEMGLGQAEVARLVGVTQQTISRWEHGDVVPPPKRLARLAEVLGLDLDQMLTYGGYLPIGSSWERLQAVNALYERMHELTEDELLGVVATVIDELRRRRTHRPDQAGSKVTPKAVGANDDGFGDRGAADSVDG